MKVLVCGATGFIGRNVAERLARRADVDVLGVWHRQTAPDIPGVSWRHADLRSAEDVAEVVRGVDVIVQAAAATSGAGVTVRAPHLHVTDNAVMNSVLLRAAHDAGTKRFIFFSCSIMYGPKDAPVRESDYAPGDPLPTTYFGAAWTKVYIEQMCEFYARLGRTRCTVIRHANVYGPYDKFDLLRSHVFGATITKVIEGQGPIVVWGDGQEGRDFIHVDDLTRFVESVLDDQAAPPCDLFNVGSGHIVGVADLVALVKRQAHVSRPVHFDATAPTIAVSVALDSSKAHSRYGWSPRISLEEGVAATLAWRRAELESAGQERRHVPA
ncbi:MAG: NAD-dependent epimerase/dehydratase family protein [Vicinamibacterales bacterium]